MLHQRFRSERFHVGLVPRPAGEILSVLGELGIVHEGEIRGDGLAGACEDPAVDGPGFEQLLGGEGGRGAGA